MRHITLTGEDAKQNSVANQIIEDAQDRQHTLIEDTIDATMIDEREIKIQKVAGVVKLVTKVDGTIYTVTLS